MRWQIQCEIIKQNVVKIIIYIVDQSRVVGGCASVIIWSLKHYQLIPKIYSRDMLSVLFLYTTQSTQYIVYTHTLSHAHCHTHTVTRTLSHTHARTHAHAHTHTHTLSHIHCHTYNRRDWDLTLT